MQMPHQCTCTVCSFRLRAPRTNIIQQDKGNVMGPMDLDLSFDDVDLGCQFNASTDALAKLAAAKKTPLRHLESSASQASGSQAIASQANATLCQQHTKKLAIEDANTKGQTANQGRGGSEWPCLHYLQGQEYTQGIATTCSGRYALQTPGGARSCNGAVHLPNW